MAATTSPPRRPRTRIRFQLDSLDFSDGRVVVSGRWHGVRGLRFVRPTLIVDGDEVLATLEHKPWPADADPWVAEFPWEDGRIDPRRTALSVAPSVTVPLAWPGDGPDEEQAPDEGHTLIELQDRLRGLQVEYDALQGRLDEAIRDRETAMRTRARMEAQRDDAVRERKAAERERDALIAARDGEAGRRDEAYRDREVALRSYRRMQEQLDAAKAASDEMEAERDRDLAERNRATAAREEAIVAREEAIVARDEAIAATDELKAQREDAVRARDDLRRRLDEAIAEQGALREQIKKLRSERRRELAASRRETHSAQPRLPDADDDRPIGTRDLTAADLLASSKNGGPAAHHHELSAGERTAIRLFGTAAFVCAFLLVVNVLGLFF